MDPIKKDPPLPTLTEWQRGLVSHSPEITRKLAAAMADLMPPNRALALHGPMGVGKTTFTQGLAARWGVETPVTSPTFALFQVYSGTRRNLLHLDAYRLSGREDAEELLMEEFLKPPWALVVEWPENIGDWLPSEAWHLDIAIRAPGVHFLRLRSGTKT